MDLKKNALIFMIMVLITGCTPTPATMPFAPTENADLHSVTPTPRGTYKFVIASGIANSDWFAEGSGLSSEINAQIPGVFSEVKETESLMQNVDLLTSGKAGLAIVYDYHVVLANQGELMSAFPDAPIEKITIKCGTEITRPMFPDYAEAARIILPLYEEQLYIIVADSSDIASISELKEKHISTGEAGLATEQLARFIFSGLGIDWETDLSHEQFDLPTAIAALENGEIDAILWSGYSPSTELSDLLNVPEAKFKLIPVTKEEAKTILQASPGIFHQSRISAGLYGSIQEDVETVATTVVLAAMEDFPEEHVTEILTAFFAPSSVEWKNRLSTKPDRSIALLSPEAQSYLHQGAVNYFAQQGVLK